MNVQPKPQYIIGYITVPINVLCQANNNWRSPFFYINNYQ